MKSTRGFTLIELLFVVVVFTTASIFFFIQKNDIEMASRDEQRKTAINAIYYSLEKVYLKENGGYPQTLDGDTLTAVDPELLKDPDGVEIGDGDSDYQYSSSDCTDGICKKYVLRATLEAEGEYVKTSED